MLHKDEPRKVSATRGKPLMTQTLHYRVAQAPVLVQGNTGHGKSEPAVIKKLHGPPTRTAIGQSSQLAAI